MTLTLLFDLDDTLLDNDVDAFVPVYLQALGRHMASYVRPDELSRSLMNATGKMIKNQAMNLTLEQVFDSAFYPALGIERQDVQATLDEFYTQEFPKLRNLTRPRPEAVAAIEAAVAAGYAIALATNPLFPLTAVQQRMAWAGTDSGKYPWRLIPSYETFHFAKPNLEYFGELLGQIGWTEGAVVMVGNDLVNDIQPARAYGLATFWLTDRANLEMEKEDLRHQQGSFRDLLTWLTTTSHELLQPEIKSGEALKAALRATPAAIATLVRNTRLESWNTKPGANTWSLTEILCHLRDADLEVNLPRVKKILTGENPFIAGRNTDIWADERQYNRQDGQQAYQAFLAARQALLDILSERSEQDWELPARHAIFGPTHLREMIAILANHDRIHLKQIWELVKPA